MLAVPLAHSSLYKCERNENILVVLHSVTKLCENLASYTKMKKKFKTFHCAFSTQQPLSQESNSFNGSANDALI